MSLTVHGYLEQPYLTTPYLASTAEFGTGSQVNRVIDSSKLLGQQVSREIAADSKTASQVNRTVAAQVPLGSQVDRTIAASASLGSQVDRVNMTAPALGSQVERLIEEALSPLGFQVDLSVTSLDALGSQVERAIGDSAKAGSQVLRSLLGASTTVGMSVLPNTWLHEICQEYLVKPYLSTPYLANDICAHGRFQVNLITMTLSPTSSQVSRVIADNKSLVGSQISRAISSQRAVSSQVSRTITGQLMRTHSQVSRQISVNRATSAQVQRAILAARHVGSQISRVFVTSLHQQVTLVLYNTTNLRVLSRFPSRGTTGTNWTASSTAPGDFSVNNLNNDIVEFVWRSNGAVSGVTLAADTGVPQGVFVDTVGILNHNLTLSAVVVLQETNDPTFSTIGHEVTLTTTLVNMFWISPLLPLAGYRYQRFVINDPTNPDGYIQIGTIVYGASTILIGDDIVDQIKWKKTHYKDVISTEGFTNVTNDRTLKRKLGLQFKDIDFQRANYAALEAIFDYARTSLKCLWIPTPQYPTRFAIFGKLSDLPDETHNDKGIDIDFIDFSLEVDESL